MKLTKGIFHGKKFNELNTKLSFIVDVMNLCKHFTIIACLFAFYDSVTITFGFC